MKKLFGKIFGFLGNKISDAEAWIKEHIQPSIETVNQIKAFVDNKALDVATTFIPGTLDDKAVAWLRKNLGNAIDCMALTSGITSEKDFFEKIKIAG